MLTKKKSLLEYSWLMAIVFGLLLLSSSVVLAQETTSGEAVTAATPTATARERFNNLTPEQRQNIRRQQLNRVDRDNNPPGPRGGPGASPDRRRVDRDNNPPGPRGGRGTNWENPPGPRGGPGASQDRRRANENRPARANRVQRVRRVNRARRRR